MQKTAAICNIVLLCFVRKGCSLSHFHVLPLILCTPNVSRVVWMLCRVLDLTECRGISTQSLQQCLTSLKSLQVLELNGDTEVRHASKPVSAQYL